MVTARKKVARMRRHKRVRNRVKGTSERPRMSVFRSNANIYAQIIDDIEGVTLVSACTLDKEIKEGLKASGNKDAAAKVGTLMAKRALAKGIKQVVFDRGGYLFHGRIKSLADGAREGGLKF